MQWSPEVSGCIVDTQLKLQNGTLKLRNRDDVLSIHQLNLLNRLKTFFGQIHHHMHHTLLDLNCDEFVDDLVQHSLIESVDALIHRDHCTMKDIVSVYDVWRSFVDSWSPDRTFSTSLFNAGDKDQAAFWYLYFGILAALLQPIALLLLPRTTTTTTTMMTLLL